MPNQNISSKEMSAQVYINLVRIAVNGEIEICEISAQRLSHLRNHRQFLKIFSAEEIIEINQRDVVISKEIENLKKIKEYICLENIESIRDGSMKKTLSEAKTRLDEMRIFISDKESKLPKVNMFWLLLLPYTALDFLLSKCIHEIKMYILRRKEKKIKKIDDKK